MTVWPSKFKMIPPQSSRGVLFITLLWNFFSICFCLLSSSFMLKQTYNHGVLFWNKLFSWKKNHGIVAATGRLSTGNPSRKPCSFASLWSHAALPSRERLNKAGVFSFSFSNVSFYSIFFNILCLPIGPRHSLRQNAVYERPSWNVILANGNALLIFVSILRFEDKRVFPRNICIMRGFTFLYDMKH